MNILIQKAEWNTSRYGNDKDVCIVEFPQIICKSTNRPFKWLPTYEQLEVITKALKEVEEKSWNNKYEKVIKNE